MNFRILPRSSHKRSRIPGKCSSKWSRTSATVAPCAGTSLWFLVNFCKGVGMCTTIAIVASPFVRGRRRRVDSIETGRAEAPALAQWIGILKHVFLGVYLEPAGVLRALSARARGPHPLRRPCEALHALRVGPSRSARTHLSTLPQPPALPEAAVA